MFDMGVMSLGRLLGLFRNRENVFDKDYEVCLEEAAEEKEEPAGKNELKKAKEWFEAGLGEISLNYMIENEKMSVESLLRMYRTREE